MINIVEALAREMAKVVYAADQDAPAEKAIYKEAVRIESQLLALSCRIDDLPKLKAKLLVKIHGED